MSTPLELLNTRIAQVVAVLCEAGAISNRCNTCGTGPAGVAPATLLTSLQTTYPTMMWDLATMDEIVAYMRQRGMVVLLGTDYFLNYDMALLGGRNAEFARACPALRQVYDKCTIQGGGNIPYCKIDCGNADPSQGCCPPQVAP